MADDWTGEDDALEARLRAWAIPVALLVAFLLVRTGPGARGSSSSSWATAAASSSARR